MYNVLDRKIEFRQIFTLLECKTRIAKIALLVGRSNIALLLAVLAKASNSQFDGSKILISTKLVDGFKFL